jgi:hypothetical protein
MERVAAVEQILDQLRELERAAAVSRPSQDRNLDPVTPGQPDVDYRNLGLPE